MFHLSIVTPERIFYEADVKSLIVPGVEGYLGVLTGHAPLITALKPGKVEIRGADNELKVVAVTKGFMEVSNNRVSVLVDAAEFAADIDISRAEAAYQKARQWLKEMSGEPTSADNVEQGMRQEALERARNRIKIYREMH